MKIDKRKSYKLIIDTETCPVDKEGSINGYNMFVYDIGFAVVDKQGRVYDTKSFVIADIFLKEKALMSSAYYADKIPRYWEDIKTGKRQLVTLYTARKSMLDIIKEYNIKEVYAHNMYFDLSSLNNTYRWVTKSKQRYFFPWGLTICCTQKMARQVVQKTPSYIKFCEKYGFLTKAKKPQIKAEVLYRYISQNVDFIESHTGLEDVLIEKEILRYCFAKHKAMERTLFKRKEQALAS